MFEGKIPKSASMIIDMISNAGYEAFLVGGCVRDMILGVTPKDWDICSNATPDELQSIFDGVYTIVPTGIAHGTVTIMIDGEGFEITVYRTDGKYSDGRRPDTVTYTPSLKEDLARRDFTMNALAYNSSVGLVDYFGGVKDIEQYMIRCVGAPDERFHEDSLRILRALRFASVKGFNIESETHKAIKNMYQQMCNLSAERIFSEISKLLKGDYAYDVLSDYTDVLLFLLPELSSMLGCVQHNPHHKYDVWEHTCRVVDGVKNEETLRLAALFHDAGKPETKVTVDGIDHFYNHPKVSAEIAERVLRRLKSSNDLIEQVTTLVTYHDAALPNKASVKRLLNKIGMDALKQLLILKEADMLAQSEYARESKIKTIEQVYKVLAEIETENACFSLKALALNGADLKELGLKQGKEIGQVLNRLLNAVIDETVENKKEELLPRAMDIVKELAN